MTLVFHGAAHLRTLGIHWCKHLPQKEKGRDRDQVSLQCSKFLRLWQAPSDGKIFKKFCPAWTQSSLDSSNSMKTPVFTQCIHSFTQLSNKYLLNPSSQNHQRPSTLPTTSVCPLWSQLSDLSSRRGKGNRAPGLRCTIFGLREAGIQIVSWLWVWP